MTLSSSITARTLATICMFFALSWLSVSLPVINAVQREISQNKSSEKDSQQQSDTTADTGEEKTESKANFPAEEFLYEYIDHKFETYASLSHVSGLSDQKYASFCADTDIQPPRA